MIETTIETLQEIKNLKTLIAIRNTDDLDIKFERMLDISPSQHSRVTRNYWHLNETQLTRILKQLEKSVEQDLKEIKIEPYE